MAERAPLLSPPVTVQEFLAWDDGTDTRYELIDGRIVAMAPPSDAHSRIAGNIAGSLHGRLKAPCAVSVEQGIRRSADNANYWQADVAVARGDVGKDVAAPEPVLLVEVVSPSSEHHDRFHKIGGYREIAGCQCILLVFGDRRRVERWLRDGARWIVTDHIGESGEIAIPALDAALDLAEIYRGVIL
jgi:Uma2 family endonuclease